MKDLILAFLGLGGKLAYLGWRDLDWGVLTLSLKIYKEVHTLCRYIKEPTYHT